MSLDQHSAAFLDAMRAMGGKPLSETPIPEARANMVGGSVQAGAPKESVQSAVDDTVPVAGGSIAVRVYTPLGAAADPLPAILHYHGGGFVLGNLDSHDSIARYYCAHANAVVVSVDYRLAPEHRFPTQVEDAYAALLWTATQRKGPLGIDPARIAVTGDSAGGNLAAVMCHLSRARGGPRVACQALLYPVTDYRPESTYPSHAEFGDGNYFLSEKDIDYFRSLYLADVPTQAADPLVSPMVWTDLSGLPPALVAVAGCDPLRDEGLAYAERLTSAGVPVTSRVFDGTIHACASFAGLIPAGREMLTFAADWLRESLHAGR
jgi:acetyl esterase